MEETAAANGQKQPDEHGRQPWLCPVINHFAIDRTLFAGGSATDGVSGTILS